MSFAAKFSPRGAGTSMTAKIIREKALVYGLWVDQPGNRKAYFVLEVESAKHNDLKRLLGSGESITLTDYGNILYSGWTEPDDTLKAEFREKYGLFTEDT